MPSGNILLINRYTRDMIRRNPNTLFVFGDNLARVGYGGQAAEARGEPNSVGIITKLSPSRYASDTDWDQLRPPIVQAFNKLAVHLFYTGGNVAWPADGVGTGLAKLDQHAPLVASAIERCRLFLFSLAGSVTLQEF